MVDDICSAFEHMGVCPSTSVRLSLVPNNTLAVFARDQFQIDKVIT